jgi:hypothetical protein
MRALGFFSILLACGLARCANLLDQFAASFGQVVTIPQTDPTPPRVTLTFVDPGGSGGNIVVGSSDSQRTIQVAKGSSFFVVATAEDSGGVKSVGFIGGSSVYCKQGEMKR